MKLSHNLKLMSGQKNNAPSVQPRVCTFMKIRQLSSELLQLHTYETEQCKMKGQLAWKKWITVRIYSYKFKFLLDHKFHCKQIYWAWTETKGNQLDSICEVSSEEFQTAVYRLTQLATQLACYGSIHGFSWNFQCFLMKTYHGRY